PYSLIRPSGVIRPILFAPNSANQTFPSAPDVIPVGTAEGVWREYSVTTPAGVSLPMRLAPLSVNQRLPSAPSVMKFGLLPGVRTVSSVTASSDARDRPTVSARACGQLAVIGEEAFVAVAVAVLSPLACGAVPPVFGGSTLVASKVPRTAMSTSAPMPAATGPRPPPDRRAGVSGGA